jgi:S-adenosylmethionine synthetase
LTGRKIIVDTYGGYAPHGGGAFSGKDPTKVDRSGAYLARKIAKNIVAAHLCNKCQVQLAYAIGMTQPVSVRIDTFDSRVNEERLIQAVEKCFDMTPQEIIERMNLRRPIYEETSAYGHFGCVTGTVPPWEETDMVDMLRHYYYTL